jgi:hypothetical protein
MTIHLNARGTWFDSIGRNAPGAFCLRFHRVQSIRPTSCRVPPLVECPPKWYSCTHRHFFVERFPKCVPRR